MDPPEQPVKFGLHLINQALLKILFPVMGLIKFISLLPGKVKLR
jgi:hypothetical protein